MLGPALRQGEVVSSAKMVCSEQAEKNATRKDDVRLE